MYVEELLLLADDQLFKAREKRDREREREYSSLLKFFFNFEI